MDTTLAAELFERQPELIALATSAETYEQLISQLTPVTLDSVHEGDAPHAEYLPEGKRVNADGGAAFVVVEGDLLLDGDEFLLYALRREASRSPLVDDPVPSIPLESSASLTGISVGGVPARWQDPTALAYCIFAESFPDKSAYVTARDNLAAAAAAWQRACGVRFVYRSEFDAHPDPTANLAVLDPSLTFSVRYLDAAGQFIASAFFPTQPPARRRLYIDPSYYAADLRFDRVGVLRHELGHVLGFRHEQIRSGAPPDCPKEEGGSFVDLTPYDPHSVMHYFCGGVGSKELALTDLDLEGAQKLYGPPLDD